MEIQNKKKTYLIVQGGSVHETTSQAKEFSGDKKRYDRDKLVYRGDGYNIYDYDKNKALPIVKMLLEDFDGQSNIFTYIMGFLIFIVLIFTTMNYFKLGSVGQEVINTKNGIATIRNVGQRTIIEKEIKEEKEITFNNGEIEEKENNESDELVKLHNENENLLMTNRSLEIEKEKYKILAGSQTDKLALYNTIKAEFYEVEKERIKKEVELEYLTGEKEVLVELEKEKIENELRVEIEKELLEKYKRILQKDLINLCDNLN